MTHPGIPTADMRSRMLIPRLLVVAVTCFLAQAGCSRQQDSDLPSQYGQRGGTLESSVNGYGVLAGMFTKAGHTVTSREELSDSLKETADVIVWAPDDFNPPAPETVRWFEDWLRAKNERTLIYIGRDFDAAPIYWRKIKAQAAKNDPDLPEIDRRLAAAEAESQYRRLGLQDGSSCDWFTIDASSTHRDVRTLDGSWLTGDNPLKIDPTQVEIELNSRLVPPSDAESLLTSDGDSLVSKRTIIGSERHGRQTTMTTSQVIVVANGSFLVNLALVNHQHRLLAGRLIGEVGSSREVVFLESQDRVPHVRSSGGSSDDEEATKSALDIFNIWPLSVLLLQWAAVIVVFCFARWPIFVPPRDPPPPPASDFGRHIAALGESLEMTRDSSYARARWQYYQDHVRGVLPGGKSSGGPRGASSAAK